MALFSKAASNRWRREASGLLVSSLSIKAEAQQ
jgi:hypothetical protein